MQIFHNLDEWRALRHSLDPQLSIGFVPTMGNLHRGHASLFSIAKQENDRSLASIFTNPTQFNRSEDFVNYPRTLNTDLQLLEQMGVDYCLLPTEESIYADHYCYQIHETKNEQLMEGKHRPGHFTGVLTVVMKLLNLASPTRAYFGEKDYQQYCLIREMATAFFMRVEIIACPTIREESGLAYSSRNNRLDTQQRLKAEKFARIFHQNKSPQELIAELRNEEITVEYLEDHENRRFVAVLIGGIRLIDNYCISSQNAAPV